MESYVIWTGKLPKDFKLCHQHELCHWDIGGKLDGDPWRFHTASGMSLKHVWQETLETSVVGRRNCLFTKIVASRPAVHAIEILLGFLYAAAETLDDEHTKLNWTKRKAWLLQKCLFQFAEGMFSAGPIEAEEDARFIIFPPFLRRVFAGLKQTISTVQVRIVSKPPSFVILLRLNAPIPLREFHGIPKQYKEPEDAV